MKYNFIFLLIFILAKSSFAVTESKLNFGERLKLSPHQEKVEKQLDSALASIKTASVEMQRRAETSGNSEEKLFWSEMSVRLEKALNTAKSPNILFELVFSRDTGKKSQ